MSESSAERRRRKLEALCKEHGIKQVAAKAGVAWETLDQVIKQVPLPPKKDGTRNPRKLGDAAAHKIETAWELGYGWFDTPDVDPSLDRVKELIEAAQRPMSFEAREICKAIDFVEPPLTARERRLILTQCLDVIERRGKPIIEAPAPSPDPPSSRAANGVSARKPKKSHRPHR